MPPKALTCSLLAFVSILWAATPVAAQTVSINGEPPPNTVTMGAATSVTISVSNGPGNARDWIALYPLGAPDSGYLSWSYLSGTGTPPSSGLISATFTTYAPLSPGDYEWRLFANDGWSRIATSSIATVTGSTALLTVNGVTAPAQASVGAGSNVTVSISGGPGNATDWIALAPAGSPNSTLIDWRYLNGTTVPPATGLSGGSVNFLAPANAGTYEIRFFAHDTSGRLATATINVSASTAALTVEDIAPPTAVPVVAGTYVSVGVTGGPAQPGDWVGLFAANATDTANLAWRYLNGTTTLPSNGQSDAQLFFAVPITAGSYEFRFFNANTTTRLATSTTMVVSASSAALSVNGVASPASVTAAAGSQAVVSLGGGPANAGDWVGLYLVGTADTATLDWRYLNDTAQLPATGSSTSTLHFLVPTTPGTYEFRFFAESGGVLSTSGDLVVPQTVAQISVNGIAPPTAVTAAPSSTLTVAINGGPANPTDWVALARQGEPNSSSLAWQYLNGLSSPPTSGLSNATLSFLLPSGTGTYELRLFAQNSFQRITTSSAIAASTGPPQVTVHMTSPFPGTTFNAPSNVVLAASASIAGGTINRVDFFTGSTLIGSVSAAPYATTWTSPSQGVHQLTASVVDSTDAVTSSAPITIAVAASGGTTGTLGKPIADPVGGFYGPGQTITLSAAPGATIRYTVDDSEPTETSPTYNGPIQATNLMTLRARAYQSGWAPSDSVAEVYAIDSTPPAVITTLNPPANEYGWHRGSVTVSFTCQDLSAVAACPSPVVVSEEGEGQLLNVSASDVYGNTGSTTVTINIDRTAPLVAITDPTNNFTTTNSTLTLEGTAVDGLAGIAAAKCNGVSATYSAGAVDCELDLRPGSNSVVLSTVDLAGNKASIGIRVKRIGTAQQLSIAPGQPTLRVGQSIALQATTEFGPIATGVDWSVSSPGIVTLSSDTEPTLTADAPGTVTLTAELGNLVAESEVTVVAGALAFGTTLWKDTSSFLGGTRVLHAQPGISGGADLFAINPSAFGAGSDVRAFDRAGRVLWTESTLGEVLFADVYGGLITQVVSTDEFGVTTSAFTRLAGGTGLPWTYELSGNLGSRPVQTGGGLIVFPESENSGTYLVGLDGSTGAIRFRTLAPGGLISAVFSGNCELAPTSVDFGAATGEMAVGEDAAIYFQHLTQTVHHTYTDCVDPFSPNNTIEWAQQLSLARITAAGTLTLQPIWSDSRGPHSTTDYTYKILFPGAVAPDGLGATVAGYEIHDQRILGQDYEIQAVNAALWRAGSSYSVPPRYAFTDPPVDFQTSALEFVGDDGTIYLRHAAGVTAMSAIDGGTMWTTPNTTLVMPQREGAALFQTSGGDLVSISNTGTATEVGSLPLDNPVQTALGIYAGTVNGGLVSMFASPVDQASFSFDLAHTFYDVTQNLGGRQSSGAAHDQRFATRELAALTALEFIYPTSSNTNWEYGGLICQAGGRFVWSPIVTLESQSEVFISDDLCPADAMAARFHTHPPLESSGPSGGDLQNANFYPMIPFYLMAPVENGPPPPLTRQWFLKYWRDANRLSQDNVCVRVAGTIWEPKTPGSGANCATPSP